MPIFLAFPELFFAGFSDVLSSMMKRETGSKTLRSERVLSRGDPNFNGRVKSFIFQGYQNCQKKCEFCKIKKDLQSVKFVVTYQVAILDWKVGVLVTGTRIFGQCGSRTGGILGSKK